MIQLSEVSLYHAFVNSKMKIRKQKHGSKFNQSGNECRAKMNLKKEGMLDRWVRDTDCYWSFFWPKDKNHDRPNFYKRTDGRERDRDGDLNPESAA